MSTEVLHLLFTAVGLALGYYLKHQSVRLPPNILALVQTLLDAKTQQDAHGLLRDLVSGAGAAPPPAPPKS